MAVFTPVTLADVSAWIQQFPSLGKPLAIKGIASGIENSNFFLTTESGDYVLTIFENLTFEQLPFYLKPNSSAGSSLPGDATHAARTPQWKVMEFDAGSKKKKQKQEQAAESATAPPAPAPAAAPK